ncbi:MAG TPA: thiamine pyrophosphate-dependent enzyme, partial [Terriglobales bacterium]
FVARIAIEYRQQFGKDVVIDMFCYRRFGHNEGDDPTMTQPLMYRMIKDHPTTRELYSRRLVAEGVASEAEIAGWIADFDKFLDAEFEAGKTYQPDKADWLDGKWAGLNLPEGEERRGETAVPRQKLLDLGLRFTSIPERIDIQRTVKRVIDNRRASIEAGENIDWATGEHLAFATLLDQGFPVRLSGQDSVRGTFVQRHCDVIDQTTEEHYTPLRHLRPGQAHFEALDSALSEEAVLGFEYGFSLNEPRTLTVWEAQFGDFANGAQVVIDQFLAASETKWSRTCGLTLLLPHGFEGQGPEHSSARLERFLQLSADDNWRVVNCTTSAQYFHVLRGQGLRRPHRPLVVLTPKSLLRHPDVASPFAALTRDGFQTVISDSEADAAQVRRVVLCSGKVYYDLTKARKAQKKTEVAIVRVEQLYPFPAEAIAAELGRYAALNDVCWCQEEPENMGAWTFVALRLAALLPKTASLAHVARKPSPSPATGSLRRHSQEQAALVSEALG